MRVKDLIAELQTMPEDAHVHLDIEEYPLVSGAYLDADEDEHDRVSAVLLEVEYAQLGELRDRG